MSVKQLHSPKPGHLSWSITKLHASGMVSRDRVGVCSSCPADASLSGAAMTAQGIARHEMIMLLAIHQRNTCQHFLRPGILAGRQLRHH